MSSTIGTACDVVIVGAGPAGGAAAIVAAQAGMRVVLLDASARPRERPGETLHPGVEPLFERLGVGDAVRGAGFLRHEGVSVQWDGPPAFVPYGADERGAWRGFQAWHPELDAILERRACELGALVVRPATVTDVVVEGDRIVGVRTRDATHRARWVVDAAGGRHVLARRLGLSVTQFSPRLFAHYGYAGEGVPGDASLAADERGWTFRAHVRPDLWQWTRLSFAGPRLDIDPAALGCPAGRPRAEDVTWREVSACAGPGWFLTGDAAAVLDPASSHGVLRAIMTGMLAAESVVAVLRGDVREEVALAHYRRWLGAWIAHDVVELRALYARLPNPPTWATED